MRDRSMQSGTEIAREIQLTDWSTPGNLTNRSSGVQIPRDICTRFGRYLYSKKCSWIIKVDNYDKKTLMYRLEQQFLKNNLKCLTRSFPVPAVYYIQGRVIQSPIKLIQDKREF